MKLFAKRASVQAGESTAEPRIVVNGGYVPDEVVVPAGTPLRLVFHRHDSSACSEQVVFPAFGVRADLPQHRDVVVELPPAEPGEYGFECGMGMLRGRLVVR